MANQNKKILVVEDDDMLRKILIDQFSQKYTTVAARDGLEALEQVKSQKPDMIILDLLMPRLDGFGFLEKLRHLPEPDLAKTAVMVVSNFSDQSSIDRTKGYGVIEYYIKSDVQMGILINRINRYFSQGS